MNDKEWKQLKVAHDHRDVSCHYKDGDYCISNNKGRCVCLYNTNFRDDICPFFHDRRTMSALEVKQYNGLFYYRGERGLIR